MSDRVASAQWTFWILGFLTVFVTAVYVFRKVTALFHEPSHSTETGAPGEVIRPAFFSPSYLLGIVAGIGVGGSLLLLLWGWFAEFLSPVVGHRRALDPSELSTGMGLELILAVAVAVGGVAAGYLSLTSLSGSRFRQSNVVKRLYVHFLNKLYFDEAYEAYVVQPTLRFARWLWRVVDRQGFDGLILGFANLTLGIARWSWRVVDLRGIDGMVVGTGKSSVQLAGWLWRVVDLRGVDRVVVGIGKQSMGIGDWLWRVIDIKVLAKRGDLSKEKTEPAAEMIRELEPRALQHHLLVMIFWLIVGMILLYWFVL